LSSLTSPSTSLMTVERRQVGDRTVLAVSGEVDIASSPALQSACETAFARGTDLWVDLCATTFMDSSGLHALAQAQRLSEGLHAQLTIVCPPGNVRRVLDLTGFSKSLRVVDHA
jgi:anti-sigma B factor antagonist